jgi:RNA polymerase sigma-70 factor (ECF subfamily)
MMTLVAEQSEKTLITRSMHGDQEAMTDLVRRHYPTSLRVARSILRNEQEAEDAVQSAYTSAFRHLETFRQDARFATWITRIVVNQSIMGLRRLQRARSVSLEELTADRGLTRYFTSGEPTPEDVAGRHETSTVICRALSKLPRKLRHAYAMYAVAGLPLNEVADKLGLSVAAVKTRVFRARSVLRSRLRRASIRCAVPA